MSAMLVLSFAILGADPMLEPAQQELKHLQGKWVVLRFERYGKKLELKEGDPELGLEIKGNKWIFTGQEKGEIDALDPKTDPKCLDIKSVEDGRKGQVDEAIYRIDGATLVVCLHQGKDKQRPIRFETTAEQPDTILMVARRLKSE